MISQHLFISSSPRFLYLIVKYSNLYVAKCSFAFNYSSKWEFPGGKVEKNETAELALKREINEEMKCDIKVGEQVDHTVYEYDFGIVHLTTYYCTLLQGTPVLTEHKAIKWLARNELLTLDWAPADIPAVKKIM